ncbi:MAG: hypothetical protein JWM11_4007 [Planctomycetaceae bacterium]|nr:hypothetical protein [Planctomycetaceae bacterium]
MTIHARKSYLALAAESAWGTTPGSPAYYHIPVTSYAVKMKRDRRKSRPFVGLLQAKHGKSFRGMPAGQLQTGMYGFKPGGAAASIMQELVDWAMSEPETVDKMSKLAEWAEGPNVSNARHNGLRVNSWTIEGSADSGTVTISLDLMGKTESALATAQAIPNDRELCIEMEFSDCTFALGGVPQQLRSFQWQGQNALAATYLNATSPSALSAGDLTETLTFTILKADDTYTAYNRAFSEVELTGQIVLKGLHNGTGTDGTAYTVLTIDFNRLSFVEPADSSGNTLIEEGLSFDVLKPDSSSAAKTLTYSEV